MLMQNFKPAADLGISEAQKEALMKTLVLLETGKLVHVPVDVDGEYRKTKYSNHFNMRYWAIDQECGTVCCIAGTANKIGGLSEENDLIGSAFNNDGLSRLFHPDDVLDHSCWGEITPAQAARALRSYLTTGDAKWTEAVSVAE